VGIPVGNRPLRVTDRPRGLPVSVRTGLPFGSGRLSLAGESAGPGARSTALTAFSFPARPVRPEMVIVPLGQVDDVRVPCAPRRAAASARALSFSRPDDRAKVDSVHP